MTPYVPLDYLKQHFRVIDPEVLMDREPTKYWDPFCERKG